MLLFQVERDQQLSTKRFQWVHMSSKFSPRRSETENSASRKFLPIVRRYVTATPLLCHRTLHTQPDVKLGLSLFGGAEGARVGVQWMLEIGTLMPGTAEEPLIPKERGASSPCHWQGPGCCGPGAAPAPAGRDGSASPWTGTSPAPATSKHSP